MTLQYMPRTTAVFEIALALMSRFETTEGILSRGRCNRLAEVAMNLAISPEASQCRANSGLALDNTTPCRLEKGIIPLNFEHVN